MIGTKVASMILDSRQLNFYKVRLSAIESCYAGGLAYLRTEAAQHRSICLS